MLENTSTRKAAHVPEPYYRPKSSRCPPGCDLTRKPWDQDTTASTIMGLICWKSVPMLRASHLAHLPDRLTTMTTRRKILLATMAFLLLLATAFLVMLMRNRSFYDAPPDSLGGGVMRVDSDLKIAVIGDSWASGQKLDQPLADALKQLGTEAEVASFGHSGGKTMHILRDLCEDPAARALMEDVEIDGYVLLAGVNDSKGHDGPDYYSHHITQIIRIMQSHGAFVVVAQVPEYGLAEIEAPSMVYWSKRQASRYLFDDGKADNRPAYRDRLAEVAGQFDRMALVSNSEIPSYHDSPELWRDPAHLNPQGYESMAEPIAREVHKLYARLRPPEP